MLNRKIRINKSFDLVPSLALKITHSILSQLLVLPPAPVEEGGERRRRRRRRGVTWNASRESRGKPRLPATPSTFRNCPLQMIIPGKVTTTTKKTPPS